MAAVMTLHDEIEIEDMDWSEELQAFTYQCPCGDLFQITLEELSSGGPGRRRRSRLSTRLLLASYKAASEAC